MTALSGAPRPGRVCPLDYAYAPSVFARRAELIAPALYVAGGLYGNLPAIEAAAAMVAAEPGAILIVNGDAHWFDAEPAWFAAVERTLAPHVAIRGNVESEIARGVGEAGCGCAYPDHVDDGTVERSNAILARLAGCASDAARTRFAGLPMHLVAAVGPARIGIVHGDATSLAGWRFDRAALDDPRARDWLAGVRAASGIDVFASTHTCAPALRRIVTTEGAMAIANNGAAGMPNARGTRFGLVTRIGVAPSPVPPLYGLTTAGVHVDALPLRYDHARFLESFDAAWPEGSPAAISYRSRMVDGPAMTFDLAAPPA
ncbi:MAG TPA: hypothetical protein VIL65_18675 [Beijerinckiaceae bacterium]